MLNSRILNIATKLYIKLRSGIVTTSQCTRDLVRMGVVTGLLLIAGLLPMLAAAQTPTGITLSLSPNTVTESSTATTITVTATLVGGRFGVERVVLFQSSVAGTATISTDYTAVSSTDLTILANMESGTRTFSFTAVDDMEAESGGETAVIEGIFLTPGGGVASISVTPATITINDQVPPVFTNMAMFTTAIEAAENQTAVGTAGFFAATGGDITNTLGGTDVVRFSITSGGTLTFDDAPNFEMPRGMALSGTNTNDYALTVTATNSAGMAASGAITVTVTDVNDAPVLDAFPMTSFTEHLLGGFNVMATDMDAGQTLSYAITGETYGATLDPTTGEFRWTPGEADGGVARTFTVTVTDDGTPPMSASTTFSITAEEDTAPAFAASASIPDQTYTVGTAITSLTLPEATGGNGAITYALTPAIPADLTFDAATRELTGTPTTAVGAMDYTYTATDADGNTAASDIATLTFSITVEADTAPAFAASASIPDQTYTVSTAIETLTLPAATGGNGTITYALTPAPPAGLSFDPGTRDFTGTPTTVATAATFTYTAMDADDNMAADDAATLTFTITVSPMVTGIDDLTDRTFNIYPNPVSGSLTVERKGIAGDEISIHDLTGKRIQVPVREQGPKKVILDVSGLAGGMYLVKVSGSGSTVRRLIVEHRQERF